MKKLIFSVSLLICAQISEARVQCMTEHDHNISPQVFYEHESEYLRPDAVATGRLLVKGMQFINFSDYGEQKMRRAFDVLEQAVNSEEFKNRVINFKNSNGERSFASNKNLTNEEIYEIFMEGREVLQPDTVGEMNFYLRLYTRWWSKVIGYTSPDTNIISINNRFFRTFSPNQVAGNLAHEWVHKLGFVHRSAKEHDSVPYAIGYIVEEIAREILNGELH